MSNNFITKISPSVRIIILMILILCLFMAKSIYLILFITTLTIVLFIITDKKVNLYVKTLKKISLLLLIFLVAYIIIFRQYSFVSIVLTAYKLVLISILIKIFLFNIEFRSMHEGIYGAFLPLKKLNINIERFSLDFILSLYFIKYLMGATENIKNLQCIRSKKILNIKNFVLPSVIYSINQLEQLQSNLKIKFYNLNYKKINLQSKIVLVLFLILFIICMFKEVIL